MSSPKIQKRKFKPKFVLQLAFPLILFTIITLLLTKHNSFKLLSTQTITHKPTSLLNTNQHDDGDEEGHSSNDNHQNLAPRTNNPIAKCDLFSGEWVPNMGAPYYTNESCGVIQEHQNCMKYGRPDTEFMKWKWKPYGCELPVFNPYQFLDFVKGKSLAFVGDSVARNHMQSLICLLSKVQRPLDVSPTEDDNFKRYYYPSYNFTLAIFWSPFLVRTQDNDPNGKAGKTFVGLFLDEANEAWTSQIDGFDYLIVSAGHWFFRPLSYYENRNFMGCRYCEKENLREYSLYYGYRSAFQTAFRAILGREGFKGAVYMRTFAPSHSEGGDWNHGGDCLRKRPFKSNETNLDGENMEAYAAQLEAFNEAQKLAQESGMRFGLIDMTRIMLMRPDGHPSMFGRPANSNPDWPSDCVHWCLPGPIDSWNDFLLEILRSDEVFPK